MRRIGGEFEIVSGRPLAGSGLDLREGSQRRLVDSGRSALRVALGALKKRGIERVYLPDFLCGSVYEATVSEGFRTASYGIDARLIADTSSLPECRGPVAVLIVDYFGSGVAAESLERLKPRLPRALFIEDDVQSLCAFLGPRRTDYRFTSLRKWLSVPDGAIVEGDGCGDVQILDVEAPFVRDKLLGAFLKGASEGFGLPDAVYLDSFQKGETLLDSQSGIHPMSAFSRRILSRYDLEGVFEARKRNTQAVLSELDGESVRPAVRFAEGTIPLAVPILIEDRDRIRGAAAERKVYLPIHWPSSPAFRPGTVGRDFERRELSLVIDQRYTAEDVRRAARAVLDARHALGGRVK